MRKLVIYTGEWCSVCLTLKKMLEHNRIQYEEVDLSGIDNYKELLYEKTGYWGTPGITLDETALDGFPHFVQLLNSGALDDLKRKED